METPNESFMKKGKRPKSATRYPKRMPTYVVAFAVQEAHDESAMGPQIPNKRSVENSIPSSKSISPSGSTNPAKTFTITPTEKMSHVLDLDVPTISEVKIDIIDENECGDIDKKSPQMSSYIVVDNRMADEQPEIIFNASKHIKRCKDNNKFPRKKPKKNKRVIKFKNIHFKYKNPKNNITRRLEKYYEKAIMNSPNSEQIQKQIYSNDISKVVSRSRILKKVLAKENLLDDADRVSGYDGVSMNEYDDGSINSSPSTTKMSFISYTSQNTLIHKSSSSSRNEDFYSMKTVNSVIQVSSEVTPYKTDVINVAVAVAYSTSKPNQQNSSTEKFMHKENLTSEEALLSPNNNNNTVLTSAPPSNDNSKYTKLDYDKLKPTLNEKDLSSETLTEFDKKSMVGVSSEDDTFVIARTSSDFNKSSFNSDYTLTSTSEPIVPTDNTCPNLLSKEEFMHNKRTSLLDTVLNIGFYPEVTASTSSGANFENYLSDVIVTENLMRSYPINTKTKGNDIPTEVKNNLSNVLKKSFDMEKLTFPQKNISLPDDAAIKAKLIESDRGQKKSCSEEFRNPAHPTNLKEMWEQLSLILDSAVKRLEDTLAEKIIKELKKTTIFNQHEYRLTKFEIQPTECKPVTMKYEEPTLKMSHKEVFVVEDHFKAETDECLQCDLVQNQVIDQLMLKLSVEGPKPVTSPTVSLKKLTKPQIVKDYFEILKPPVVDGSSIVEVGKGDTVTVSTATAEFHTEEYEGFQRLKILIAGPMAFIRENLFVITSIPTFFIVMLCLYGVIVIITKPW